jgi:hypothetical protein
MAEAAALEISELAYVLVRLEQAVNETAAGMRQGMTMVGGLFSLFVVIGVVEQWWGFVVIGVPMAAMVFWIGKKASEKTSPERMRPVMEAVRDAPERITLVRHYQTSDSRRVFVTDWLEIKTAEHRLVIKAKDDWQRLHSALQRRCPGAQFVG